VAIPPPLPSRLWTPPEPPLFVYALQAGLPQPHEGACSGRQPPFAGESLIRWVRQGELQDPCTLLSDTLLSQEIEAARPDRGLALTR
jgi:hypothetical protein